MFCAGETRSHMAGVIRSVKRLTRKIPGINPGLSFKM
jgi:hypothetical protein